MGSNLSIIENIPPNVVSISGFISIFACLLPISLVLFRDTMTSGIPDMTKPQATFCCSCTFKLLQLKCCGIKNSYFTTTKKHIKNDKYSISDMDR